ncbi:hypothetical protein [Streptomyces sp. NPDC029003]|uniref:hypothetical protein n=1 Tax=Streptomyces sp. NPDC029003 TaxID=3155125 RepID=UPI0033C09E4B
MASKTNSTNHHSLVYIRDLTDEEKESIDAAQRLLRSFAASWEWEEANRAVTHVLDIVKECISSTEKASGHFSRNDQTNLSRAVIEASLKISSWPSAVISGEARHLGIGEGARNRILDAATKALSSSTLQVMLKIANCGDDRLASLAQTNGDGSDEKYVAFLTQEALESAGVPRPANWMIKEIILAGLSQLKLLAATVLTSYRDHIEGASRLLIGLQGEVIYGLPILLPKEELSNAAGGPKDLSMTPIEMSSIEGLMRATDAAANVLSAATPPAPGQQEEQRIPVHTAPPAASAKEKAPPGVPDLTMLLTHVSQLSSDIEKQWSSSFMADTQARSEILTKWYSFVDALKDRVHRQDERASGSTLRPFPMQAKDFSPPLPLTPTQRALDESSVAVVYCFQNLIVAMKGLSEPTLSELNLVTGAEHHWWESGAFESVRRAAETALRAVDRRDQLLGSQEVDDSTATLASAPPSNDTALQYAQMGQVALRAGLPEASAQYFALALRRLAAELGSQSDSPNAAATSISVSTRREYAVPAEQIMRLVESMSTGQPVPLEKLVNLANFWRSEIMQVIGAAFSLRAEQTERNRG